MMWNDKICDIFNKCDWIRIKLVHIVDNKKLYVNNSGCKMEPRIDWIFWVLIVLTWKKKTKKQKNKKTIPKKKFDFVFDSKNSVQNFSFKK